MLQVPPWSLLRGNVCLHSHPAMTNAHLSLVASMSLNLLWLGPSQLSRNLSLQEPVTQPTPPSSGKHLLPWLPFSASSVDDPSPHLLPPVAPGIRPPASSLPWVHSPHGNLSHRCHRSADDPQVHVMPTPAVPVVPAGSSDLQGPREQGSPSPNPQTSLCTPAPARGP